MTKVLLLLLFTLTPALGCLFRKKDDILLGPLPPQREGVLNRKMWWAGISKGKDRDVTVDDDEEDEDGGAAARRAQGRKRAGS